MKPDPTITVWRAPAWLHGETDGVATLTSLEDRMRFVIGLATRNVAERTGGPYAAAVFEPATARLVAAGVNLVQGAGCSSAHAEVVTLACAQKALGTCDPRAGAELQLVTSSEPCLMCLGATFYAGIGSLACGAREEDWRRFGFDDLGKPFDWVGELAARGVTTVRDVLRDEAIAPLRAYGDLIGATSDGR